MRNLLVVLTLSALITVSGCSSNGPLDKVALPEPGPTGLDEQQFDDVPALRGFRLLTRRSFSHQVGSLRIGSFTYQGIRLKPAAALEAYVKDMVQPMYGWTLVTHDEPGLVATFTKGRDEARIACVKLAQQTRVIVDVNYREEPSRTQP